MERDSGPTEGIKKPASHVSVGRYIEESVLAEGLDLLRPIGN
jgi:hypothetical protein